MFELKKDYQIKDLQFDRIKPRHKYLLKKFETFEQDLKDFLVEDAFFSQEMCVSNTLLVFDKGNFTRNKKNGEELILLGYVTILTDSISLDSSLKTRFKQKGIGYRSLPSLKIGRICVGDEYQKKGIGKCLLFESIRRIIYLNQNVACRFITLDAKRNPKKDKDSFHFYKKYGFKILKKRSGKTDADIAKQKSGTTPLYLDLYHIIRTKKRLLGF